MFVEFIYIFEYFVSPNKLIHSKTHFEEHGYDVRKIWFSKQLKGLDCSPIIKVENDTVDRYWVTRWRNPDWTVFFSFL